MATILSQFSARTLTTVTAPTAGNVAVNDYFIDLTAAQLVAGNIIDLGVLPANHTVTDAVLISDALGAGMTVNIGIMSGIPGDDLSARTCNSEFYAASNAPGDGAAAISRMTAKTGFLVKAEEFDRSIGIQIVAAPTAPAAGRIRLRVLMHGSDHKVTF